MNLLNAKNYDDLSRKAAMLIAAQIIEKPNSVIGFATGSTPVGTYKELVKMYNENTVDFSTITSFNLDEYYGLDKDHDQSYYYFMMQNLFGQVNINKDKINIPNGMAEDVEKECRDYEEKIRNAGGIDVQILGIGLNGHIGFNEPSDEFPDFTHMVQLKEDTIKANSRFFNSIDEVPTTAISMGIKSIMNAKKIILLASGKEKIEIVKKAIYEPVTPNVPASILQYHNNVTVIICE